MIETIYIGAYDNKIYITNFEDGDLKFVNQSPTIINPSYIHINKDILYAVSETKTGGVQCFKIRGNALETINLKIINEELPCHITTDLNRTKMLVSNYGTGSVLMYELEKNGSIKDMINSVKYNNAHMHYSQFVSENIYAVDLGNDCIYIYDNNMKLLTQIHLNKGTGPRHLVITKDSNQIMVVTELSNELLIYIRQNNEFKLRQQIKILENKNIKSYAAAIKISNDEKNIYVTNRGHNSISVYRKNEEDMYECIQTISSFGDFPRDITLNKSEEYAIVTNQKSNNISIFKRDIVDGKLEKINQIENVFEKPSCAIVL